MEEDAKCVVDHQCRLNPNMNKLVWNEAVEFDEARYPKELKCGCQSH